MTMILTQYFFTVYDWKIILKLSKLTDGPVTGTIGWDTIIDEFFPFFVIFGFNVVLITGDSSFEFVIFSVEYVTLAVGPVFVFISGDSWIGSCDLRDDNGTVAEAVSDDGSGPDNDLRSRLNFDTSSNLAVWIRISSVLSSDKVL